MLHPHLRLPVEAGERCWYCFPPRLVEQAVVIKNKLNNAKNRIRRIPGFGGIFFNISM
jgi:hypothetical protein